MDKDLKIALIGNPNSGKTTLFNRLTGLNQKVGNYPGITVDKRSGSITLPSGQKAELTDLPGTYSLSSKTIEEQVVQNILLNPSDANFPDVAVLVIDVTNLKRNLFLATQIMDLKIPAVLALNMADVLENQAESIDVDALKSEFGLPVLCISSKTGQGTEELSNIIERGTKTTDSLFVDIEKIGGEVLQSYVATNQTTDNLYRSFKTLNNYKTISDKESSEKTEVFLQNKAYNIPKVELLEINERYQKITNLVSRVLKDKKQTREAGITRKIDRYVTHPFWGSLIFILIFFTLFQAVFTFAQWPMDVVHEGILLLGNWVADLLPDGIFKDFISDGIFSGLAGVLIFVPQIMILFGFIALLEESGYLARAGFFSDGILKRFGLNGKSIVPLVGGFACAIPAIMSARTIESKKERLITIFITPLMSCSARLPVYVFLVSFIVPNEYIGFISIQGLFMTGLYLLGLVFGLVIAWVMSRFIKEKNQSSFILEIPNYKMPRLKNAITGMLNKGKIFVLEAGKVIMIASIILWALSYFGPAESMEKVEKKYADDSLLELFSADEIEMKKRSEKLENSYLGIIGKTIEPVFEPIGFDWKTGIAVLASFAAREVFVGTMATIYSVEETMDGPKGLKAIRFSYPTALSLLIFYVFALQCVSTMAIVKQETGSWGIVFLQFFIFTGIAYTGSFIVYRLFL